MWVWTVLSWLSTWAHKKVMLKHFKRTLVFVKINNDICNEDIWFQCCAPSIELLNSNFLYKLFNHEFGALHVSELCFRLEKQLFMCFCTFISLWMCFMFSVSDLQPVAKSRKRLEVNDPPSHQAPSHQPPEVPTRSRAPPKQNQAGIKPICAPKSSFAPPAPERNVSTSVPPGKHHEWKPTVVNNLMSLKKKFQKKTNQPQDVTDSENVYSEISDGPDERCDGADNEYQEITGLQNLGSPPHHRTVMGQTHPVLPQEYHPPPPFAPGY